MHSERSRSILSERTICSPLISISPDLRAHVFHLRCRAQQHPQRAEARGRRARGAQRAEEGVSQLETWEAGEAALHLFGRGEEGGGLRADELFEPDAEEGVVRIVPLHKAVELQQLVVRLVAVVIGIDPIRL